MPNYNNKNVNNVSPTDIAELYRKLQLKDTDQAASSSLDAQSSGARPRTTTSWGKRSTKPRKPMQKTNVTYSHAAPEKIPPGQYLSKTSSEVNNDPLADKAYFPGPSEEFRRIADRKKIYSGCEALPTITENTYCKATCLSPSYGKTVPRSAHDYFVAVMTYYRLLSLEKMNGRPITYMESIFVDQIASSNLTVPKSVNMYLSGFGNTKAPRSREIEFKFHKPTLNETIVPNPDDAVGGWTIPGYFGNMNDHIGQYASYPCLAVYMQRILQDLRVTRNAALPINWDLPADLAMPNHAINVNCLGYAPARRLPSEHQNFYNNINLTLENFVFDNDDLPIHLELLTAVHMKLEHTKQPLFALPSTLTGSVGQLAQEVVQDQVTQVAIRATFSGKAAFEMPGAEGYLGCSFLYFMNKDYDELRIIKSLLPVTFRVNEPVNIETRQLLNFNYTNSAEFIKTKLYETVGYSPILRFEDIVKLDSPREN